jgi:hypothetical protein
MYSRNDVAGLLLQRLQIGRSGQSTSIITRLLCRLISSGDDAAARLRHGHEPFQNLVFKKVPMVPARNPSGFGKPPRLDPAVDGEATLIEAEPLLNLCERDESEIRGGDARFLDAS